MTAIDVPSETEAPVRCAPWTKSQGVDPIGSMGSHRAYLFVEWPLPWPHDIGEIPDLAELRAELREGGVRLQGLVPLDNDHRRVILYTRGDGPFTRFTARELVAGSTDVITAARLLLAGEGDEVPAGRIDAMVCTHGRRDRCCGSLGTTLAMSLLADPTQLGAGVQARRTSHTGGHRFAPTAMVFPEGTGWAFVDAELLTRVAQRQGPVTDVLPFYRGGAGMSTPRQQVLERAVLAEVGWDLLDWPRSGSEGPDGTVRLHAETPEGPVTWEAEVTEGRVLPVPDCGSPVTAARKTNTEFDLHGLRRLP